MFERLKLYSVHVKTDDTGQVEDVQFVKEGFNFWAFLLQLFWALYHRCWLLAALCIAILVVTNMLTQFGSLSYHSLVILELGGRVIIGLLANDERRESLAKRGYRQDGFVSGLSMARATQRYYDRMDGMATTHY